MKSRFFFKKTRAELTSWLGIISLVLPLNAEAYVTKQYCHFLRQRRSLCACQTDIKVFLSPIVEEAANV